MPHLAYTDEELNLGPNWDLDPDSNQPLSPRIRDEIRKARVIAHENEELRAKQAVFERQEAFRKAGIPADARGDLFARGNPDLTDPTDIKNAWEATFGPLEQETPTPGAPAAGAPATTPAEAAARRVAEAGAAAAGAGGAPGDIDLAKGMEDAWEQGGNEGLKAFIAANGAFSTPIVDDDGRLVHGISLPDID